jgi:hypothetical protein
LGYWRGLSDGQQRFGAILHPKIANVKESSMERLKTEIRAMIETKRTT